MVLRGNVKEFSKKLKKEMKEASRSQLYEKALEKGWPLPDRWDGYSQYSYDCLPLPTNYLNQGEVLSFRDYAFNAYYENPRYLQKIKRLFGIDTVKHIQEMTKHRLKRKYTQF